VILDWLKPITIGEIYSPWYKSICCGGIEEIGRIYPSVEEAVKSMKED